MRNNVLKFVLLASLALNFSLLGTTGFLYYLEVKSRATLLDSSSKKERYLYESLSLSPEQMLAMHESARSFHAEVDKRSREIDLKKKELIALVRAPQSDGKAIAAVVSEISGMQEMVQQLIVAHLLAGKDTLDMEQQKKFFDLLEENMAKKGRAGSGCPPADLQ